MSCFISLVLATMNAMEAITHKMDYRMKIMSGFHRAFATGVASQQGTLTLPDTWFRPPANAPIVETKFLELAMSLLDFSPRIPLGTFSSLLLAYSWTRTTLNLWVVNEIFYLLICKC